MGGGAPGGASSPPTVAVVGCGKWGQNLVRTFAGLGALAAVVDPDPAAAGAAEAHGAPALPLPEVLDDPAVEAVAIAVPAATHAEVAAAALDARKDVFVEKPLALTVADAEAVVARAESTGRVLMVGHLLRYHPAFLALRELAGAGELGDLRYLYSNRLNLGRFRREESSLWSFAPHDLSMILALVGGEPSRVSAVGATYLTAGVPDVTTTHLEFPSGPSAHVFVSWLHPYKEQRLVVVGSEAMAVFDDARPWAEKLTVFDHKVRWDRGAPSPVRADGRPVVLAEAEPLRLEAQHFLDCIATRSVPRTDGHEGLRVLRVLAAAQASLAGEPGSPPAGAAPAPPAGGVQVHPSAVVDHDVRIGDGTRVWHFSHLQAGATVGRDCTLGQNVVIGPGVTVGDRCRIQNNVSVYSGVVLEEGVFCGPSCVFTNVHHPRAEVSRQDEFGPTVVRRGATIGANATIVCGNDIGEYAFVGAGAVVTAGVAPHALVVGNPARPIGWVSHDGERLGEDLTCPRSGRRYQVVDGGLRAIEAAPAP